MYIPLIGLEIHVQPKTQSKMFCGCSTDIFGAEPNTRTCPVCLGLPGALPVPNRVAIEQTLNLGLALQGDIAIYSQFDRKNYFYPDLPKGYQISQYKHPLVSGGALSFTLPNGQSKHVTFERVHLEEDTARLQHGTENGEQFTLVDFNRSGMPLIEIVTAFPPAIQSAEEAKYFLRKLRQVLRYAGISDADMEKGTMRVEPNVSVMSDQQLATSYQQNNQKTKGQKPIANSWPQYKVELKNINSFRYAEKAIEYEIERQITILEKGEIPIQETRGWDEQKNITVSQRRKEDAHDYRYFPEPDIPPLVLAEDMLETLYTRLPKLPTEWEVELKETLNLGPVDIETLLEKPVLLMFVSALTDRLPPGEARKYTMELINQPEIPELNVDEYILQKQQDQTEVVADQSELTAIAQEILQDYPAEVARYKEGKQELLKFFIGQVMAQTKGKASPHVAMEVLQNLLAE